MSKMFIVRIENNLILFSEQKFHEFCKNAKPGNWLFFVGEADSNKPFISSKKLSTEQFLEIFNPSDIPHLLKYKCNRFGTNTVSDVPLFPSRIYKQFGERIGWNEKY